MSATHFSAIAETISTAIHFFRRKVLISLSTKAIIINDQAPSKLSIVYIRSQVVVEDLMCPFPSREAMT